jgi:hypothetical protein
MAQLGSQLKLLPSREVQESLLNCAEEGTNMVTSLVDGSLFEGQSRSFYNPSTRSKLKSFEDMTHKTKLKCRSGDTVTVHMNPRFDRTEDYNFKKSRAKYPESFSTFDMLMCI